LLYPLTASHPSSHSTVVTSYGDLATRKKPTMIPLSSWINQRTRPFFLRVVSNNGSVLPPISIRLLNNNALGQNTVSSPVGQNVAGKRILSTALASNTTQPQARKPHSLIPKPALSQFAMVIPPVSIPPTSASTSSPSKTSTATNATQTTETPQPVPSGVSSAGSAIQQSSICTASFVSSTVANGVGPSLVSTTRSKSSSGGTGLIAAVSAGSSSLGDTSSSRAMGRLLSEMPGINQLISPSSFSTTPPPAPVIGESPTGVAFTAQRNGGNSATQTLTISKTSGGTLTWSTGDNVTWLPLAPASSTGTITLTAATGPLTTGTHNEPITVAASGATSQAVGVTLTANPTATSLANLMWNANTDQDLACHKVY
jgi:hypothetical protein